MKNVSSRRGIDTSSIRSRSIEFSSYTFPQLGPRWTFFFTRLFTARSACIHLTGQPSQTGFPPAVKKPCPHFVHLLLLFPLSFLLFLRANLPTIFLHDRVLFYISRSIEELINREKSFVIVGEWSIWEG